MSIQLSAMYEDLEYEFNGVSSLSAAMEAFGFDANNSMSSFNRNIAPDTSGNKFRVVTESDRACIRFGAMDTAQDCNPVVTEKQIGTAQGGLEVSETMPLKHVKDAEFIEENDGIENVRNLLYRVGTMESAGDNVKIEREAWLISGKIKFGGPLDFRFSYMDADDLEVSCSVCSGDWQETAADAWNVGLFYTMPAGTELRLTYSEVNNDDNGSYGQGVSGTGRGTPGVEVEVFAVGIVHWFD